jgi:anti-sigma B factor antagonist
MNITKSKIDDITVLELEGPLTLEANTQFRKSAATAIEAGARKLILNMARVESMDSRGLGELIACYVSLQKLNGRMTLLHLNQRLHNLLAITKLYKVFDTFDSESAAVASFTPGTQTKVPSW